MTPRRNRAVFLDRDGVLNVDRGYTYKLEDLELYADVGTSLQLLKQNKFLLIVITNQSGISRNYFRMKDVERFHARMQDELSRTFGLSIDRFYICPHYPDGDCAPYNVICDCRKPGTRNIEIAISELGIDRTESFMVGDRGSDIESGRAAGLKTIQILRPGGKARVEGADFYGHGLAEAADFILARTRLG